MKSFLEQWDSKYIEKDIKDGRAKALIIDMPIIPEIPVKQNLDNNPEVAFQGDIPKEIKAAEKKL